MVTKDFQQQATAVTALKRHKKYGGSQYNTIWSISRIDDACGLLK